MNLKPWTFAGICLCVLLVGAFLGRLSTSHRHNQITVNIEEGTNKINLAPEKEDVIKWIDQANRPVNVRFLTDAPCEEIKNPADTTDTCTIKISSGNFQYACSGSSTCVDPGVDPRSNTGLVAFAPGNGLVAPPAEGGSVVATISCPDPNGTPVVTWVPDPPGPSVNVDENIVWKAGSLNFTVSGFNDQNTPVQLCSQPTINQSSGHRTCTVVKDGNQTPPYRVTYTVTTSGTNACGSTSPTLTVNPAPQPSAPTGKS
jgi:hypothetical protein